MNEEEGKKECKVHERYEKVDEWMVGWMSGCKDVWLDGWINEWMDGTYTSV